MINGPATERDPSLRCKSSELEKPGRTHLCRLTAEHGEKHVCLCSRSWEEFEAVKA